MWSTYIMNLLLILQAWGTTPPPDSDAAAFDYNGNGQIDVGDFLYHLSEQPPNQWK